MRKKDRIDIEIVNDKKRSTQLVVAMSGNRVPFGGSVADMLQQEVRQRFPLDNPKDYWKYSLILKRGESLRIIKKKKHTAKGTSYEYCLVHRGKKGKKSIPKETVTRKCTYTHQLLFYAVQKQVR